MLEKPAPRIDWSRFEDIAPGAVAALRSLGRVVEESGLEKPLVELVKIRVSQLNGCAYCLRLHLNIAHRLEIPSEKLEMIAVWRESGAFSPRERTALAWAERLTNMGTSPVTDADFEHVGTELSESEVVFLTVAVAHINAWNRLAGSLRFDPPSLRKRRVEEPAP